MVYRSLVESENQKEQQNNSFCKHKTPQKRKKKSKTTVKTLFPKKVKRLTPLPQTTSLLLPKIILGATRSKFSTFCFCLTDDM